MNIYDCFMYFDEDLLLDIRLNHLDKFVNKFVIVEANYTHNGNKKKLSAISTIIICLIFVPGIMASENWDDHDRSDRYTARDVASNYLNSCAKKSAFESV